MFKPVRGKDLEEFDEETRQLYSVRQNDPRLSYVLSVVPRRERHNLPVIVDSTNNPYLQEMEAQNRNFKYRYMALATLFGFAA